MTTIVRHKNGCEFEGEGMVTDVRIVKWNPLDGVHVHIEIVCSCIRKDCPYECLREYRIPVHELGNILQNHRLDDIPY